MSAADDERGRRSNDGRIDVRSALAIGTSIVAMVAASAPFVFDLGGKAQALGAVQKDVSRVEGRMLAVESRQQISGESAASTRATLDAIQAQLAAVVTQLTSMSGRLDAIAQQQRSTQR